MKFSIVAMTALLLAALSGVAIADEMPFDQAHYEAMHNNGKPFAPSADAAGRRMDPRASRRRTWWQAVSADVTRSPCQCCSDSHPPF
jgi:hypothetical protein